MIHNFTRKQLIASSDLDSWKLFSAFFIGSEIKTKQSQFFSFYFHILSNFTTFNMAGWQLEVFKMALYMAFPVGMFHYFNQPEYFEKWVKI